MTAPLTEAEAIASRDLTFRCHAEPEMRRRYYAYREIHGDVAPDEFVDTLRAASDPDWVDAMTEAQIELREVWV